ncbi:MAG TPA: dihydrodipicolinate reductase C-terminal domain-containing protein [Gemmatimonadaceae bacterium]|nr:dihydrodipicolinate reductase C-terminal domain-containing protein [Gemmatimonadaceae bacterium]
MTARRMAIIGDGKMGTAVAAVAREKGWEVTAIIGERDSDGGKGISSSSLGKPDVAVEFTEPGAAAANITACLQAKIPVVVGTTGWYDALPELTRLAGQTGTSLLWSPNFSLGVNVFLELARLAGALIRASGGFDAHIVETHHTRKKDAPSGTAIAIAGEAGDGLGRAVPITSVRTGEVPGTHELIFDGLHEQLTLTHSARDRRVFAEGAVHAAGWLVGKSGVFTMRDVLRTEAGSSRKAQAEVHGPR